LASHPCIFQLLKFSNILHKYIGDFIRVNQFPIIHFEKKSGESRIVFLKKTLDPTPLLIEKCMVPFS